MCTLSLPYLESVGGARTAVSCLTLCCCCVCVHLQVYIGEEDIIDSPFQLRLVADQPDLARTEATGTGITRIEAGVPATFSLKLFDKHANISVASNAFTFGMLLTDRHTDGKVKRRAHTPALATLQTRQ